MHIKKIVYAGQAPADASKALIMLHGRGASAMDILSLAGELDAADFCIAAPEATGHSWYPYSFLAPQSANEPWLSSALGLVKQTVEELIAEGIAREQIFILGFSQGACLTLEFAARNAARFGGIISFTGGLIGKELNTENYSGDFGSTPVFIGNSDRDPHVPLERTHESTAIFKKMNAVATEKIYPGMPHTVNEDEIAAARGMLHIIAT